ncbi:dorsal-ventral patterning protein Sog isoform X2 [Procambarus clarkii]|uniref:dorsal-ventral patterning protein Sog isoform X2 n=1 Tax=Procambarus clarkii TaxID=6728 RepID=UPI003742AFD5
MQLTVICLVWLQLCCFRSSSSSSSSSHQQQSVRERVLVQRKRRMVARVRCRNIKTECPKVTCLDPVLLPGACCKTCVTEMLRSPVDEPRDMAEELTGRDFAVLLNGRTSQTPMTTSRVATGRLFLRKKTLHFSFLLEAGAPPPASIQFLNDSGDILEQLEAQPTPYEATNNRICGAWTRVPKEYRALLRDEKMWVAISPPDDSQEDVISGQLARYVGVDTEVFSALLTPTPTANQTLSGGGTAIISVDRKTDSLHVSLVFNGIFAAEESRNATLVVELLPERGLDPVTDTVVLPKVFSDLNRAEIMTTLGDNSLIRLTRGQVAMKIWSQAAPERALEGMITPRATCNVFSAVLSIPVPDPEDVDAPERTDASSPHGAGWALLTLSNDGTFQYQVFVKDFDVATLTLETKHRRRDRIVDNLTPFYRENWANGTYDRPTYSDLDALLRGKLEVVVSAGENSEELRGMLNPVAVTEALRSPQPVLLSSPEVPMAATVWVAVDSACVTHYDVMVAGQPPGGAVEPFWNLILRERDDSWDPRHENTRVDLETQVEGRELFAHSTQLTRLSLSRLGAGVTYLDLVLLPHENNTTLQPSLSGLVQGVSVPSNCLLGSDVHDMIMPERDSEECSHGMCVLDETEAEAVSNNCIDEEKRVFEDGTSWQSPVNTCSMCMCRRGKITCQDVVCLELDCDGAYTPPNQCCQVCPGGSDVAEEKKMCELNNQKHLVGSKWHPFLPPEGFDKCVSCACELNSSAQPVVNCHRSPCPLLSCDVDDMEQQPDSCCAKCRATRPEVALPTAQPGMVNEGDLLTEEEHRNNILSRGGCLRNNRVVYENGAEWHPRVASIGFYKCVTCKCKDRNITCVNQQCPTLRCPAMVQEEQECCPRCTNENSTINNRNKAQWRKPFRTPSHKNKNNRMRSSGYGQAVNTGNKFYGG